LNYLIKINYKLVIYWFVIVLDLNIRDVLVVISYIVCFLFNYQGE
jgi:hypothetical protein